MTNQYYATVTDINTKETTSVPLSPEECAEIDAGRLAESTNQAMRELRENAQAALDRSDLVALRCLKAGVAFPADWQAYTISARQSLRDWVTPLLALPPYPAGT